eukprot:7774205-Pyramimonas_sp.AAC.1
MPDPALDPGGQALLRRGVGAGSRQLLVHPATETAVPGVQRQEAGSGISRGRRWSSRDIRARTYATDATTRSKPHYIDIGSAGVTQTPSPTSTPRT